MWELLKKCRIILFSVAHSLRSHKVPLILLLCSHPCLYASEASGPQKTKLSYIFSIIPTFKKKFPHFHGHSMWIPHTNTKLSSKKQNLGNFIKNVGQWDKLPKCRTNVGQNCKMWEMWDVCTAWFCHKTLRVQICGNAQCSLRSYHHLYCIVLSLNWTNRSLQHFLFLNSFNSWRWSLRKLYCRYGYQARKGQNYTMIKDLDNWVQRYLESS